MNKKHTWLPRFGIRGLVIDPYNELDHQRPTYMTETEYVSQMLTKIKRFAQYHEVHVWLVAHPGNSRTGEARPQICTTSAAVPTSSTRQIMASSCTGPGTPTLALPTR